MVGRVEGKIALVTGGAMGLDKADCEALAAKEHYGGLAVLVNNAANVIPENIEVCFTNNFRLQMDIHVMGTFFGCKYALPLMKHHHRAGGGYSIINIASLAALMGHSRLPAYLAAKGAIRSMTRSTAIQWQDEGYGIRFNALSLGGIETPMVMGISGRAEEEPLKINDGPLRSDWLGHPKGVAACVLFLASDKARLLNGLEIPMDGGSYARPYN